jgi:hypothetical protein
LIYNNLQNINYILKHKKREGGDQPPLLSEIIFVSRTGFKRGYGNDGPSPYSCSRISLDTHTIISFTHLH